MPALVKQTECTAESFIALLGRPSVDENLFSEELPLRPGATIPDEDLFSDWVFSVILILRRKDQNDWRKHVILNVVKNLPPRRATIT